MEPVPCNRPPVVAGADVALAPAYAPLYTVYDLGPVPGVPNPLGGAAVDPADPSRLLIAGASERPDGAIYEIGLERNPCGHIVGFQGTAQLIAQTPHVDANLAFKSPELLVYAQWPQHKVSQLRTGESTPARTTDLTTLGVDAIYDRGPGGVGFVPPGLAAAGELRILTWPLGKWYQLASAPDGDLLAVTAATQTATLPNNPGGFAYVPAGSPAFPNQAILVAEWRMGDPQEDRVVAYDADEQGDPIPQTRREFMTKFPRPWGAYFEPVTGDYLFLSWGTGADRVFLVDGFVPPPIL
ncbi:MAG: hypothetical protein ACKV2T_12415 [Kofleriaceae bacterium]